MRATMLCRFCGERRVHTHERLPHAIKLACECGVRKLIPYKLAWSRVVEALNNVEEA